MKARDKKTYEEFWAKSLRRKQIWVRHWRKLLAILSRLNDKSEKVLWW
jgi:hypothetical protein